jgi:hypothetical protein
MGPYRLVDFFVKDWVVMVMVMVTAFMIGSNGYRK